MCVCCVCVVCVCVVCVVCVLCVCCVCVVCVLCVCCVCVLVCMHACMHVCACVCVCASLSYVSCHYFTVGEYVNGTYILIQVDSNIDMLCINVSKSRLFSSIQTMNMKPMPRKMTL